MFKFSRLVTVAIAIVLIGGSSLAGVTLARSGANSERKTLEARIAALEAGNKARFEGLGSELTGLRQAVHTDGRTVKVSGEAYLPSNLSAVVIAFEVAPTRPTVGAAITAAKSLASKVASAVRDAGVAAGDVRTVWDGAFPQAPDESAGYSAHARLLTTVRHLTNIDRVTNAALKSSREVTLAYLNVSDESDTDALAAARQDALKDARATALRYAKVAGRTLGQLTSLSEQVSPETAPAEPGDGYAYRPAFVVVVDASYELK